MVYFQNIDLARFIQIFLVQGLVGFFFLYLAYRILKRDAKGLSLILSCFYLSTTIGVVINIIYAFIFVEIIVLVLHFITYFFLCLSLIFLLLFVTVLMKSEKVITKKKQIFTLIIFSIAILVLLAFPNGITINETTNWKPKWSWPFLIYSFIICTSVVIPTIYYSIKLYLRFEHQELKKKWKYFLIGMFSYYFLYYGTSISNALANDTFRIIWSIISLPSLISLYFVYYG
ncbi:MAG: hypothetical protein ACFFD1_13790, partial [Candidatus Thorarchaeota archaeon]